MWQVLGANERIWKIANSTDSKSAVSDCGRVAVDLLDGHMTYFVETRSGCSKHIWRFSVTDGYIKKYQ